MKPILYYGTCHLFGTTDISVTGHAVQVVHLSCHSVGRGICQRLETKEDASAVLQYRSTAN